MGEESRQEGAVQTGALSEALQELERLNRVMRTMNATLDLDEVLELFISELEAAFSFEGIAVLLLSEDRRQLRTRKLRIPGLAQERVEEIIRETEAISLDRRQGGGVAMALLDKRDYYFNEIDPERLPPGPNRTAVLRTGLRSVLIMPLLVKDEAIGVMMMSAYSRCLDFSAPELESIRRFVDQLCQAVKNSQLHEELLLAQQRLRRKTLQLEEANSMLEQQKNMLEQLSRTDELTGVHNRRWFFERAKEKLAQSQRLSQRLFIFMLDIDDFKAINDTYGHQRGDEVLAELAMVLKGVVRRSDLLARYGGEEFIVASMEASDEGAFVLAERLRQSIAEHEFRHGSPMLRLTVSVGYSCHFLSVSELPTCEATIKQADEALYAAKAAGKNRSVYRHGPDFLSPISSAGPKPQPHNN